MADENPKEEQNTAAPEATQETKVAQPKEEVPQVDPQEFLANFDWDKYEEGIERVEDSKLQEFETLVEENFVDTADEEVVEGKVI